MMPKKILIFSLAYFPHVGGAEVAIQEITDRIAPGDIEFHMITMRFAPSELIEEKIGNVFVHRVGKNSSYLSKILFMPRAAWRARKLNKLLHFDGMWAMMTYMIFPVVLLRMLLVKLPYALTLQDGDPFEHVFGRWFIAPLRPMLRRGFKHARIVQTISSYLAGWARRMEYTGTIEVIPNGVNVAQFSGPAVAHDGTVLITTSRLVEKNGVDSMIKAVKFLPEPTRLQILGTGQLESSLKELAKYEKVEKRVEFVGHVDGKDIPNYLHAADIFIRPSRSEGMGNSFIEAFAAGLPVIATQVGGITDFLFDAKKNPGIPTTGWAVDVDSPVQIAEAVEDILEHPDQAKKVIENAKALAKEKYDWSLIAKDMQEKVFDILGR